jgi:hypothetical protein
MILLRMCGRGKASDRLFQKEDRDHARVQKASIPDWKRAVRSPGSNTWQIDGADCQRIGHGKQLHPSLTQGADRAWFRSPSGQRPSYSAGRGVVSPQTGIGDCQAEAQYIKKASSSLLQDQGIRCAHTRRSRDAGTRMLRAAFPLSHADHAQQTRRPGGSESAPARFQC